MNREDIIRMAEECGIPEFENNESQADNIVRFAALVVAAERERIIAANAPEIERVNAYIKSLEEAASTEPPQRKTHEFIGLDLKEMDEIIDGNMKITDSRLRDAVYAVVIDTVTTLMEKNSG